MNETATYTLGEVVDTQQVILRDVAGFPAIPQPYGSTHVIADYVRISYRRVAPSQTWQISGIKAAGWRMKKDGTAGGIPQDASFNNWGSHFAEETPAWLIELAEKFLPNDSRTAAYLPGMAGADRTAADVVADLDTLKG